MFVAGYETPCSSKLQWTSHPRDEEGTKTHKGTVYNRGADSITAPLAKNYATLDFLEKGS